MKNNVDSIKSEKKQKNWYNYQKYTYLCCVKSEESSVEKDGSVLPIEK